MLVKFIFPANRVAIASVSLKIARVLDNLHSNTILFVFKENEVLHCQ